MNEYLKKYPAVLTVSQVAEILGCCEPCVRKLVKNKQLAAVKVGRLIKIPKDRLVDYLSVA